jgi:hypothetical protein
MIELGEDYAEILFGNNQYDYANNLMEIFKTYKAPEKEAAMRSTSLRFPIPGLN